MAHHNTKWKTSSVSLTYNSWRAMRNRCLYDNENSKNYKLKGITICNEWEEDFDKFVEDMGIRPEDTTLDRIDPYGNYCKDNCRWATWREQENNKPTLTKVQHNEECKTIGEWAYILDLTSTELARAYKRHSSYNCTSFEELFTVNNLLADRVAKRVNKCKICGRSSSVKWRKFGDLCNTCYHKALRWSKRENKNIENYPEWKGIQWKTTHIHLS